MLSLKAPGKCKSFPKVHSEKKAGAEKGAADPKERRTSIKLFYITLRSSRAHRLDLITLMRVAYRARRVILRVFVFFRYARSKISQISGKTFRARK